MKTKWGLTALFGLFFIAVMVSCEDGNESGTDVDVSSVDPEVEEVNEFMKHLELFDVVRGDGTNNYSLEISFDKQGDIVSTICKKQMEDISSGRVSATQPKPLCKSDDLDYSFAQCAKKIAEDSGCITIKTCAWCVYACDDGASTEHNEDSSEGTQGAEGID